MFYTVKDYDAKWTDVFEIYRHKIVHYIILFCIEFTYLFFTVTITFISFFIYFPIGMQFAANPREFTRFGMPKYGADLSDDENDVEPYENILEDDARHSKVTFATSTSTSDNTATRPGIPSYCKVIPSQSRNTPAKPNQAGIDRMAMIRNEVRETASSRARGDLTGDLDGVGYFSKSGISSSRSGGSDLFRPLRTTVAYDSELDMESSDESDGNM